MKKMEINAYKVFDEIVIIVHDGWARSFCSCKNYKVKPAGSLALLKDCDHTASNFVSDYNFLFSIQKENVKKIHDVEDINGIFGGLIELVIDLKKCVKDKKKITVRDKLLMITKILAVDL